MISESRLRTSLQVAKLPTKVKKAGRRDGRPEIIDRMWLKAVLVISQ